MNPISSFLYISLAFTLSFFHSLHLTFYSHINKEIKLIQSCFARSISPSFSLSLSSFLIHTIYLCPYQFLSLSPYLLPYISYSLISCRSHLYDIFNLESKEPKSLCSSCQLCINALALLSARLNYSNSRTELA